ncbi:ceramide synthase 6 isoform X1 [Cryptotermes secundus]|uniref:ceramide synthase 6 isoform X1 n=1 Tax=Cryptotermes secundus TaxID=105785 RepID=UPI000CD7DCDD|nr:ceramide synthase 6 isoform X1 [Cryptotermes secundus]
MSLLQTLMDKFWNPDVWLPPNVTWADLEPNDKIAYAEYRHLVIPLPLAVVLLVLRFILERYWFASVGISLGIKNTKPKKAPPNEILERAYLSKGKIKHKQIVGLAKQVELSERQVERWLCLRRSQDKPSTLTKFCETCWRCLYYTCSFSYGVFCLWEKPWLCDINHSWYGYPHQSITSDCWWYYMISLAFYWSLTVSQFFDVKRKDFWQMFIHHIAAICLMGFSWVCNLHRIGTLVLLTHDCSDIFLEAAKMAKYANYQRVCDALFVLFTILWIITRLGVFPMWIIYSTAIEAPNYVEMFPAYYVFNSLLLLLLVLHLFWTYVILKIAYKSMVAGQMEGDIRSSSSDEVSGESDNHANISPSPNSLHLRSNSRTGADQ